MNAGWTTALQSKRMSATEFERRSRDATELWEKPAAGELEQTEYVRPIKI